MWILPLATMAGPGFGPLIPGSCWIHVSCFCSLYEQTIEAGRGEGFVPTLETSLGFTPITCSSRFAQSSFDCLRQWGFPFGRSFWKVQYTKRCKMLYLKQCDLVAGTFNGESNNWGGGLCPPLTWTLLCERAQSLHFDVGSLSSGSSGLLVWLQRS